MPYKDRDAEQANKRKRNATYYAKNRERLIADACERQRADPAAAAQGLEVDHVIPLRGRNVSGLHVETNLQLLSRPDNIRKGNRYEVEAP